MVGAATDVVTEYPIEVCEVREPAILRGVLESFAEQNDPELKSEGCRVIQVKEKVEERPPKVKEAARAEGEDRKL